MAHLERFEKDSGATRTLSPGALRVILRLTNLNANPLTSEGMNVFSRTLHGNETKGSASVLAFKENSYYLDFKALDGDEADTNLTRAVEATNKALLEVLPYAEVSGAWTIPTDGPQVWQNTPNWQEVATDITGRAQDVFTLHRSEQIDASAKLIQGSFNFDSLLY